MNTKLSFAFCLLLISGLAAQAQTSFSEYNLASNPVETTHASLSKSENFVSNLINKYKFKKGVSIDDFSAFNTAVLPLSRTERNLYQKSSSRLSFRLFGNPFPEGPGNILVDRFGHVSSYAYTIAAAKEVSTVNDAYESILADITKSVDPKFITDTKDGVAINIPGSETTISIHKLTAGQWHAVGILFN